jgi:hypothetical protein
MNIGTKLANWMRTDIPPSEPEIREIEKILNSLERNNFAARNWPGTPGVIDYNEVVIAADSTISVQRSWFL